MNCALGHKWSKWSEPRQDVQQRTCLRCGIVERRIVWISMRLGRGDVVVPLDTTPQGSPPPAPPRKRPAPIPTENLLGGER
jgi:hypothetical protein